MNNNKKGVINVFALVLITMAFAIEAQGQLGGLFRRNKDKDKPQAEEQKRSLWERMTRKPTTKPPTEESGEPIAEDLGKVQKLLSYDEAKDQLTVSMDGLAGQKELQANIRKLLVEQSGELVSTYRLVNNHLNACVKYMELTQDQIDTVKLNEAKYAKAKARQWELFENDDSIGDIKTVLLTEAANNEGAGNMVKQALEKSKEERSAKKALKDMQVIASTEHVMKSAEADINTAQAGRDAALESIKSETTQLRVKVVAETATIGVVIYALTKELEEKRSNPILNALAIKKVIDLLKDATATQKELVSMKAFAEDANELVDTINGQVDSIIAVGSQINKVLADTSKVIREEFSTLKATDEEIAAFNAFNEKLKSEDANHMLELEFK